MIEFGPHTLISGGGGCLSLALAGSPGSLRRTIAEQALAICGFRHTFTGERFAAIVKRMLLPLCRGFSEIVATGTKNDAWEAIDGFAQECRKLRSE